MIRNASLLGLYAICLSLSTGCNNPESTAFVKIGSTLWTVELAETAIQRSRGLAGRDSLPDGSGMLFVFGDSRVRTFWMRGCLIPLDVAFIDTNLRIVVIHTMPAEADQAGRVHYSSLLPVRYALEVPAGAFARAGVKTGDKVFFSGNIPAGS